MSRVWNRDLIESSIVYFMKFVNWTAVLKEYNCNSKYGDYNGKVAMS